MRTVDYYKGRGVVYHVISDYHDNQSFDRDLRKKMQ